jgi:hypothetical protein
VKIQLINELMHSAGVEPLTKEQLHALARTPAGKKFESALLRYQAGDQSAKTVLSLVSLSHIPVTRAKLRALGFHCSQEQLTQLLLDQGASLTALMDKAMADSNERRIFVAFMMGLGHTLLPAESHPGTAPYYSFKVFAQSGALTISEARTRGNEHTVQIDAASALVDGGRPSYDWKNKIVLQLSPGEMLQALALFERQIAKLNLVGHGLAHDKFAQFAVQDGKYFVRIGQQSRFVVALPILPPDAIRIISLLYKQLIANDPHLDVAGIRSLLQTMSKMWNGPESAISKLSP